LLFNTVSTVQDVNCNIHRIEYSVFYPNCLLHYLEFYGSMAKNTEGLLYLLVGK